jgi:hypothetical protein
LSQQTSLGKIITVDYAAFAAFIFPLLLWVIYGVLYFYREVKPTDLTLPAVYAVLTLLSAAVVAWRVRLINQIFDKGVEAKGTISHVAFFRDRGRLEYTYFYMGQKYKSGNAVHRVKKTRDIQVGEQVVVLLDPDKPERAFIRDLYISDF